MQVSPAKKRKKKRQIVRFLAKNESQGTGDDNGTTSFGALAALSSKRASGVASSIAGCCVRPLMRGRWAFGVS